ncbi:TonB-dependent receptor [Segetibacter sp. 3557_3]|uniref:SusC/RagA family TonB-linked outer membrane protein n=1 Tax=Segetibacter sp. 3557_3 TaxID=2547429 RepID=UPI0010587521|nr:TonB-dependent receptor [Segetibacter sp. 3557_3]TDH23538.1 TonB-dependent receptor [Segetibacter sp. 3557_3]
MKMLFLPRGAFMVILLLFYSLTFSQTGFRVTGKVSNEQGEGLSGVTVQVKNTTAAASTGNDGSFTINAPSGNATLVFSYVGFASQEIALRNRAQVNVTMAAAAAALENVVVVGYGTQKRSDVTGALTSISAETLRERPVTNVLQALQGKAAGMNVGSNLRPGELPSVRIRGNRSINASNDPLYVVDGIPIVSALGVTSFSINDINPNDVASVEVLKDASATAIYGSRGANGVILITTKKGSKGRISINYNSTVSLDSYKTLLDWQNAGEYIDELRQALINGRSYQPTNPANLFTAPQQWYPDWVLDSTKFGTANITNNINPLLDAVRKGYERNPDGTIRTRPTTPEEQALGWPAQVPVYNSQNIPTYDWRDAVVRQGITQNHQLSISTGNEASRLYLSLGYNNQLGVQRDQDFERFNLNINGDITANKWLTLGTSIIGSLSNQNYGVNPPNTANTGAKDLFSRAAEQYPWAQPTDANGVFIINPGGNLNQWNPLIDIEQAKNERRSSSIMANVFTEVKLTSWLKYRVNFGAQLRNFRNGAWTGPNATNHLTNRPNTAGYTHDENFSWVAENLLYFNKDFGKAHSLGATLLQSAQKSRRESINANVSGTTIPISLWYDLGSNTEGRPQGYGTGFTENTLSSFMGRVNYTLLNKYLLTASGRYDGSSVLSTGNKWSFFPSFALAWKMHEEDFLQNANWINEIKPRFGYGVTGNSSVNPYTTSGPLSRNPYIFGTLPGIGYLPQLVQNPDLGWEKTAQWNLGVDFSILKRRISGALEYYQATTTDLLFQRTLPGVSGYVQKFVNIGQTRNKGVEVTLTTRNIDNRDFSWTTDLNFAANTEEIVELTNGKQDILSERLFIGQPTRVFYHYANAGIWQNTKEDLDEMAKFNAAPGNHRFYPGTIKIVDQNGDYRINAEDYVIRGSNRPRWTGGITNTFRYKDLQLSSFVYARIGQTYFGGYPGLFSRNEADRWSWNNPGGSWPMVIAGPSVVDNFSPAMQFNSGSFVVVRNISLSYDFPDKLINRATIKNLQLNVQVLNPFIFGGAAVKAGINPDDETNWDAVSQANSNNTSPLGGANNNTILPQSIVFGVRLGL